MWASGGARVGWRWSCEAVSAERPRVDGVRARELPSLFGGCREGEHGEEGRRRAAAGNLSARAMMGTFSVNDTDL